MEYFSSNHPNISWLNKQTSNMPHNNHLFNHSNYNSLNRNHHNSNNQLDHRQHNLNTKANHKDLWSGLGR